MTFKFTRVTRVINKLVFVSKFIKTSTKQFYGHGQLPTQSTTTHLYAVYAFTIMSMRAKENESGAGLRFLLA